MLLGVALLLYALLLVLFFFTWTFGSQRALVLTPFVLFSANEILRVWPATVAALASGLSRDLYVVLVCALGFVAFLLFYLLTLGLIRSRRNLVWDFTSRPVLSDVHPKAIFWALCGVSIGLVAAGLFLYQGFPPVVEGVHRLLTGSSPDEVANLIGDGRKMITKGHYFGGEYRGQGLLRTLMRVGWAYVSALALVMFRTQGGLRWLFFGLAAALLCFAFVAGDGTRGPLVEVLIYIVIVVSFQRIISMRTVVVALVAIFSVAILLSSLSPKLESARSRGVGAVESIATRILFGNGINNVHAIELIRSGDLQLRGGELHLRNLKAAIPGVQPGHNFSHELYRILNPGSTATTYSSGTYLMTIYVDFGLPGTVIVYGIIGIVVALLQDRLFRKRKVDRAVPFLAYLSFLGGSLSIIGFTGFAAWLTVLLFVHITTVLLCRLLQGTRNRARLVLQTGSSGSREMSLLG